MTDENIVSRGDITFRLSNILIKSLNEFNEILAEEDRSLIALSELVLAASSLVRSYEDEIKIEEEEV